MDDIVQADGFESYGHRRHRTFVEIAAGFHAEREFDRLVARARALLREDEPQLLVIPELVEGSYCSWPRDAARAAPAPGWAVADADWDEPLMSEPAAHPDGIDGTN